MPPQAPAAQSQGDNTWVVFALMTVAFWGLYGPFLQFGSAAMIPPGSHSPADHVPARYKAFLFVGIAYLLTAVIGPIVMMLINKTPFTFSGSGIGLSLFAGILGAAGAFCVLLAFGAKGPPAAVMSIIFAGAPVVNSIFLVLYNKNKLDEINPLFFLGILFAAAGGCLVTFYRPPPPKPVAAIVEKATEAADKAKDALPPPPENK
jgi:drug/metabolite transporter (DMT)-like permease